MNNTNVDSYLAEGCGRCDKFRTPDCKVHRWTEPLRLLRGLMQQSGLTEEMKWGAPCYTLGGKNVAMIFALKDSCGLSFLRGAELDDEAGLLESAGPNSKVAKLLRFSDLQTARAHSGAIVSFVAAAMELERAGAKPRAKAEEAAIPEALAARLDNDAALRAAWEALTPGRRRSHALHVGGAKQAETQVRRAEACSTFILDGRGFNER